MALVTTQSKPFVQLVDLQQKSLKTLLDIRDSVSQTASAKTSLVQAAQLDQLKKLLDVQKNALNLSRKQTNNGLKEMSELSKSMKNWKTWGDKIRDVTRNMSDAMNPTAIGKKLFGAFNIGGIFNKKIAAADYVQKRAALGDTGPDVKARGKQYASSLYRGLRAQDDIDRMKRAGASDDDIASTKKGRAALRAVNKSNREMKILDQGQTLDGKSAKDAANPMGGNTAGKSVPLTYSDKSNKMGGNPTTDNPLKDAQSSHETQVETLRQNKLQTDLLSRIAANTSRGGGSAAGGKEDKGKSGGSRMLDGFSSSVKGIGDAVGSLGSGVGKGVGGLIGGVILGIMQGIANGIAAFGTAKVLKGVAVMGLMAGVLYGMTQALNSFTQLDFDSVTKGLLAIAAVATGIAVMGKMLPLMLKGSLALGAIALALWGVGQAFQAIGDGFDSLTGGLTKLTNLDGDGLFKVAGGITAVSAALAAFSIGSVASGLGTLISNLLTFGQDSPIDQLSKLADMGDRLNNAANGISSIAQAMQLFSKIDNQTLKVLNDFPWKSMAVFVAAGGTMSANGAKVYDSSKGNADGQAQVNAQNAKGGGNTNVSTAVSNSSTTQQIIKLPSRNNESSYSAYSRSRYA